jgi:anti-sigma-K factor RskA
MTTNEDLHELTAAYALDALDHDERRAYEAHLPTCERCRVGLRDLGETVGALALAAEGSGPSEGLRDRVIAAARAEGPSNVVAIGSRRRRWYAASVAAAAAVGLAIGLWAALSGGGNPSPKLAVSHAPSGASLASVSGFDAAPPGKVYELWVIEGKTPHPAGLFSGGDKQVVTLTRPAPVGSTVAVTLEKAGGAKAPTPPVLVPTAVTA